MGRPSVESAERLVTELEDLLRAMRPTLRDLLPARADAEPPVIVLCASRAESGAARPWEPQVYGVFSRAEASRGYPAARGMLGFEPPVGCVWCVVVTREITRVLPFATRP